MTPREEVSPNCETNNSYVGIVITISHNIMNIPPTNGPVNGWRLVKKSNPICNQLVLEKYLSLTKVCCKAEVDIMRNKNQLKVLQQPWGMTILPLNADPKTINTLTYIFIRDFFTIHDVPY